MKIKRTILLNYIFTVKITLIEYNHNEIINKRNIEFVEYIFFFWVPSYNYIFQKVFCQIFWSLQNIKNNIDLNILSIIMQLNITYFTRNAKSLHGINWLQPSTIFKTRRSNAIQSIWNWCQTSTLSKTRRFKWCNMFH